MSKTIYTPTKADLWEELCKSREQMIEALNKNSDVIARNVMSIDSLHSVVNNMQKSLDLLVQQLLALTNGVPAKIFLMVVGVLILIILVLLGVGVEDLRKLVAGG